MAGSPATIEPLPEPLREAAGGWSGRKVVVGMFAFGLTVVAGFWTYWFVYDRPLAPLRRQIQADLPDTMVQIASGTAKTSQRNELRIVIQTPFRPTNDDRAETIFEAVQNRVDAWGPSRAFETIEVIQYEEIGERHEAYWRRSFAPSPPSTAL